MNHRIALRAGLAALGVAGIMATPVQAQVYLEPGGQAVPPPQHDLGGLPPSEILAAVRSSGLRPLTQPARLGPQQYVVLASDNMGGQLRVVVNANTGRIVHAAPAHDPRFAYDPVRPRGFVPTSPQHGVIAPPPTYSAAPPPDLRTATPPLPPRTARAAPQTPPTAAPSHNQNLAGAPDATGSVPTRPARTPLPRPRPAMAANEASAAAAPASPTPARPVETSPEADTPAAAQPAPAAPSAAPATPAPTETQMVPVAPLD